MRPIAHRLILLAASIGAAAIVAGLTLPRMTARTELYYDRLEGGIVEVRRAWARGPEARRAWQREAPGRPRIVGEQIEERDGAIIHIARKRGELPAATLRVLEPNDRGGYDATYERSVLAIGGPDGASTPDLARELLACLPDPTPPTEGVACDAWIRVTDERCVEHLRARAKDAPDAGRILRDAVEDGEPLAILLALDDAVEREDEHAARKLLTNHAPHLEASDSPFLRTAPKYYRAWLEASELSREGRNVAGRLEDACRCPGDLEPLYDRASYGDIAWPLKRPLLDGWFGADPGDFLRLQASSRRRIEDAGGALLLGRPELALEAILPCHRVAVALMGASPHRMHRRVGIAIADAAARQIGLVLVDGLWDADQLAAAWPVFDAAWREQSRATPPSRWLALLEELHPSNMAGGCGPTDRGAPCRTALARMALAHSGAAARHRFLSRGTWPQADQLWADLLPEGPDADPFSPTGDALRYFHHPRRGFVLYSVGPDGLDQRAEALWDPASGPDAAGDLFIEIPGADPRLVAEADRNDDATMPMALLPDEPMVLHEPVRG